MKITYVGHATVIVETDSCKFITDPLLVKRIAWIGPKRLAGLRLDPDALDDIDFITISHGHFDHLDLQSMFMIDKDVPVICHPTLRRIVRITGHKPITLDWWDSKEINGFKVSAVPSYHLSCRPPFHFSRDYQGYIIETEKTLYHAGDCGMRDYFFREIKKRFKIDVAFLPIGAYYPFRKHHLSPEDALDAMATIMGARGLVIPMHWGTYKVSSEPIDEPPKRLEQYARQKGIESRYRLLQPGESIDL